LISILRRQTYGTSASRRPSSPIEIISKIIIKKGEGNIVRGISTLSEKIKGSYSLVVLTGKGIYASSDIYGFRPLILGGDSERFAVSSESRTIQNMDMEIHS
jgi:amidophosphoribosyltransferase